MKPPKGWEPPPENMGTVPEDSKEEAVTLTKTRLAQRIDGRYRKSKNNMRCIKVPK